MLTARRMAAAVLVLLLAGVIVGQAVGPARADAVRDTQAWVLRAVRARAAWRVTRGQGVTVAVIDSGVNPDVSDLTGSVTTGPDLTGVGTPMSSPFWGIHGTWMASLIAGHGHGYHHDDGIIGVAPRAHILSIRVITDRSDPGYQQYQRQSQARSQRELARALWYAVQHRAAVISMSLGYDEASVQVRAALQAAYTHGVVVVASAGNSGRTAAAITRGQAPYSFPADYPGVLAVGAVSQAGAPAGFSSDNLSVSVAAPGVQVPAQGRDGRYWLVSGTSPACALTAGVAALIKSAYPRLSPALVQEAIVSTTRDRPPGGYDERVGFGTVDAAAALARARQLSVGRSAAAGISPAAHFGGGPAAVPQSPVGSRGLRELALFCVLGAACLGLIVAATGRLLLTQPVQHGAAKPAQSDTSPPGGTAPAVQYGAALPARDGAALPAQGGTAPAGQDRSAPPGQHPTASPGQRAAPPPAERITPGPPTGRPRTTGWPEA